MFANLDGDGALSQSLREELMEQLILVHGLDVEVVIGKVFDFCRSHQCQGKRNKTAQDATLGHVEERNKTESTLSSTAFGMTPLVRRNRSAVLFLDKLLAEDLAGQKRLLGRVPLSRWIMWSFYQPRRVDAPFHGVSTRQAELIRRLGLGRTDNDEELIFWSHRLEPDQLAHRPTAFDAGTYDYYCPGGKTRPLTGGDGLHEVVHPPIRANQLTTQIKLAS